MYQSPKVPPRRSPPDTLPKPKLPAPKEHLDTKTDSLPAKESNSIPPSNKLPADEQNSKLALDEKARSTSKEDSTKVTVTSSSVSSLDPAVADGHPSSPARAAVAPANLQLESNATSTAPNCAAKEVAKTTTPVTSPRTPSKIPTPLPRKAVGVKSSPTSSASSPSSPPVSPSSPKTPLLKSRPSSVKSPTGQTSSPQFPKASEIPVPVGSNVSCSASIVIPVSSPSSSLEQSSPSSSSSLSAKHISSPTFSTKHQVTVGEETLLPAERRRTVVEICEKVVVPQGKTPTTPPVTPFITVDRVSEKQSAATEVRIDQQSSSPCSRKS